MSLGNCTFAEELFAFLGTGLLVEELLERSKVAEDKCAREAACAHSEHNNKREEDGIRNAENPIRLVVDIHIGQNRARRRGCEHRKRLCGGGVRCEAH